MKHPQLTPATTRAVIPPPRTLTFVAVVGVLLKHESAPARAVVTSDGVRAQLAATGVVDRALVAVEVVADAEA